MFGNLAVVIVEADVEVENTELLEERFARVLTADRNICIFGTRVKRGLKEKFERRTLFEFVYHCKDSYY